MHGYKLFFGSVESILVALVLLHRAVPDCVSVLLLTERVSDFEFKNIVAISC